MPRSLNELVAALDAWHQEQMNILADLERLDPDLVATAVYAFDDRRDAASWICGYNMVLDSTPLQRIAEGGRQEVVTILQKLIHGVYS